MRRPSTCGPSTWMHAQWKIIIVMEPNAVAAAAGRPVALVSPLIRICSSVVLRNAIAMKLAETHRRDTACRVD